MQMKTISIHSNARRVKSIGLKNTRKRKNACRGTILRHNQTKQGRMLAFHQNAWYTSEQVFEQHGHDSQLVLYAGLTLSEPYFLFPCSGSRLCCTLPLCTVVLSPDISSCISVSDFDVHSSLYGSFKPIPSTIKWQVVVNRRKGQRPTCEILMSRKRCWN